MGYVVIKEFRDLQDNNYLYTEDKPFPREGMTVLPSRIKELASSKNRRGEPLIKEVEEPKAEEPKKERKSKSVEKTDEE